MKAILTRTASGCSLPVHSSLISGSPKFDKVSATNISLSLHTDLNHSPMSQAFSAPAMMIPFATAARSQLFPPRIPEEEVSDAGDDCLELDYFRIPAKELGYSGDGFGRGRMSGGGSSCNDFGTRGGGADGGNKICDYYEKVLKADPNNPLLLRNYGKFLYEVEGNTGRAEECYGRAILANPGDGELLSLYGKLIWDTQRDVGRAKSYFNPAVQASPHDCMVLGSYAQFMWEAEDDDDEEEREVNPVLFNMVKAF